MEKIKLVQIIADSDLGGGPTHVLGLLQNINKGKFDCFLLCPPGLLAVRAKELEGVSVIKLPFRSKFDLQTIFRLKRELEKIQASGDPFAKMIIHSHGPRAGYFVSLATPKSIPTVYTEHVYTDDYKVPSRLNGFIQRQMMNNVYQKADAIIAVSSAVKRYLQRRKVQGQKISVIPNGIILSKNTAASKSFSNSRDGNKGKSNSLVIGNISNLLWQKGQIYLIRAFKKVREKYPQAMLEIIGEGAERADLEDEILRNGLENSAKLLGHKKDPRKYLSEWNVFVLPSLAEPFGIAILEAMQAGIPVVASKTGGIVDIIQDRKNGILVPSKDIDKLAEAILEILDDKDLGNKLTKTAKKSLEKFDWREIIKEIEHLYGAI